MNNKTNKYLVHAVYGVNANKRRTGNSTIMTAVCQQPDKYQLLMYLFLIARIRQEISIRVLPKDVNSTTLRINEEIYVTLVAQLIRDLLHLVDN